MAIGRGQTYMTVVVPTHVKRWVTRKARQESRDVGERVSRSRVVSRILKQALIAEGPSSAAPSIPSSPGG